MAFTAGVGVSLPADRLAPSGPGGCPSHSSSSSRWRCHTSSFNFFQFACEGSERASGAADAMMKKRRPCPVPDPVSKYVQNRGKLLRNFQLALEKTRLERPSPFFGFRLGAAMEPDPEGDPESSRAGSVKAFLRERQVRAFLHEGLRGNVDCVDRVWQHVCAMRIQQAWRRWLWCVYSDMPSLEEVQHSIAFWSSRGAVHYHTNIWMEEAD